MASERLLKEHRLRRAADFKHVYERRQSAGDGLLLVFGCENGLSHPRIGLSVSRKVGPAVVRNRWKRRIREAFRIHLDRLPAGLDLIVIPRAREEPAFDDLARSLARCAERIARRTTGKAAP
jgi:ribonuclease P protein component